jgi:hypothetical protein
VRYVRNGVITQHSVHYYRSTRVRQRNCFAFFCKYLGHEEKDFCAFDLMREHTFDMYRIQEENDTS